MSGPLGSSQWMYSTGAGGFYPYEIGQSLRFNDGDSAYLATTVSTASSTYTLSLWLKRGVIASSDYQYIFSSGVAGLAIGSTAGDTDKFYTYNGATITATPSVYRDPSAWYHLLLSVASNTGTLYVNGESVLTGAPCASLSTTANATRLGHYGGGGAFYFDGYMAEVNFIDGSALTPSSFGELKSDIWIPKAYTGSYGTNGSYLTFEDSAAIGDDLSGNGNDWTPTNLASTDVMLDSPTNNFATLSPLIPTTGSFSEGNLKYTSDATYRSAFSPFNVTSGKWYFEGLVTLLADDSVIGVAYQPLNTLAYIGGTATSWGYEAIFGGIYNNTVSLVSAATYTTGDIIGVAFDADTGELWFAKNGVWQNSGDPATSTSPGATLPTGKTYAFGVTGGATGSWLCNFGQDSSFSGNKTAQGNADGNGVGDFYYTPPAGFLALNTANLPDPTIDPAQDDVPADYFNTVLWTGDGNPTRSITAVGFQPDLVWIKERTTGYNHVLQDAVRGFTTSSKLSSNLTEVEGGASVADDFGYIDGALTDGFTLNEASGGSSLQTNQSGNAYVAWNWLAGNGTSSNTDGTITSTVSVNQKAEFSVVSWTATANANDTVGHGLGVTPIFRIDKNRDSTEDWWVYTLASGGYQYLRLNTTGAAVSYGAVQPTSSVFTTHSSTASGDNFISYCFAEVEGFSKFGSYTGNGSANGPFVYCGFRPAFIMVKRTNTTGNWTILDNSREGYNVDNDPLYPNLSNAEGTTDLSDLLSSGFKLRSTDASVNASGSTYIFAAFAQQPVKFSNAR